MQCIKSNTDELEALGKPLDHEDLIENILEGLGNEYSPVIDANNARDNLISFDELHEKLINRELSPTVITLTPTPLPVTAHIATSCPTNWRPQNRNNRTPWSPLTPPTSQCGTRNPPRGCRDQGHTVPQCLVFRKMQPKLQLPPPGRPSSTPQQRTNPPWQPRANVAITDNSDGSNWLLDSSASHHVTTDLSNLSIHSPYSGPDDVVIGDGTSLPISHTSST